ncbi:MAG: 6-phosphogluconolactonase, partial [Cellvibrionaceae bacterium]
MTSTSNYFLFAGSYAPATEPGIHAFAFNSDTGELTPQGSFTGITSPSFLTIHPNGRWLYAVSETGLGSHGQAGSVWAFEIQPETMALQPLNQQSTNGDWPCHVAIDATGRWIIASNYGSGNAALYPITADGSLGEMASFVQHAGKGPNKARQEGPHAHSATFTPDNNYV